MAAVWVLLVVVLCTITSGRAGDDLPADSVGFSLAGHAYDDVEASLSAKQEQDVSTDNLLPAAASLDSVPPETGPHTEEEDVSPPVDIVEADQPVIGLGEDDGDGWAADRDGDLVNPANVEHPVQGPPSEDLGPDDGFAASADGDLVKGYPGEKPHHRHPAPPAPAPPPPSSPLQQERHHSHPTHHRHHQHQHRAEVEQGPPATGPSPLEDFQASAQNALRGVENTASPEGFVNTPFPNGFDEAEPIAAALSRSETLMRLLNGGTLRPSSTAGDASHAEYAPSTVRPTLENVKEEEKALQKKLDKLHKEEATAQVPSPLNLPAAPPPPPPPSSSSQGLGLNPVQKIVHKKLRHHRRPRFSFDMQEIVIHEPTKCPNNCSSRGVCRAGECNCFMGWGGPDCSKECKGDGVCDS